MTLIREILNERQWSGEVEPKWRPPEGFFTRSSSEIAKGLKAASSSYGQAAKRLSFYINRAGKNLSGEDAARLEAAKKSLRRLYGINEDYRLREEDNMSYNPINTKTVSDIHAVAQKHLSNVANKDAVKKMLTVAYSRGFSAGASELEGQYKKHVAAVASKEAIAAAVDDAFSRGFSAGRSSWQK